MKCIPVLSTDTFTHFPLASADSVAYLSVLNAEAAPGIRAVRSKARMYIWNRVAYNNFIR